MQIRDMDLPNETPSNSLANFSSDRNYMFREAPKIYKCIGKEEK